MFPKFNGTLEMVDPHTIIVDHRYQRDEKHALMFAIGRDFQWEAFGAPTVFERTTGERYCADGQQRLGAVKLMDGGPAVVPVLVFKGKDLKTEADVFGRINEYRRALTPMEKHKGQLVAENPAALAIQRAVENAGFTLTPGGSGENNIQAIGTLRTVYNNLGEKGVQEVLDLHRKTWPDDDVSAWMLKLLMQLLVEAGDEYDQRPLSDALSAVTPGRIMRKAEEMRHTMGGSLRVNVRRATKELVKI